MVGEARPGKAAFKTAAAGGGRTKRRILHERAGARKTVKEWR